jgi:hypothetical protein
MPQSTKKNKKTTPKKPQKKKQFQTRKQQKHQQKGTKKPLQKSLTRKTSKKCSWNKKETTRGRPSKNIVVSKKQQEKIEVKETIINQKIKLPKTRSLIFKRKKYFCNFSPYFFFSSSFPSLSTKLFLQKILDKKISSKKTQKK